MINICTCDNPNQDSLHGIKRRVMNVCKKGTAIRCTVCLREYPLSSSEKKDLKVDKKK